MMLFNFQHWNKGCFIIGVIWLLILYSIDNHFYTAISTSPVLPSDRFPKYVPLTVLIRYGEPIIYYYYSIYYRLYYSVAVR